MIVFSFALTANDTIFIDENQYVIDHDLKLVLSNIDLELINTNPAESKTHINLDITYQFAEAVDEVTRGSAYQVSANQNDTYSLYFTDLPIIQIETSAEIIDEADTPAYFTMIESNGNLTQSDIGIQYRGGWSQTLPKKSMEIEFWTDPKESDQQDFALLGMRSDDDWNLQAMYNEPLRIRSKTNFALWQMIDTLHYLDDEPDASNTVNLEYAELFIDGSYRGVYVVGEKIDRKQLKLKSHNGSIRGELYKGVSWGATTLGSLPPYDNNSEQWGGFEYKYPDNEIDWSRIHDFVDFVINSPDAAFYEGIEEQFDMDNAVNYFIFMNTLRALDNTGKNIYVAKYSANEPYFYVAWDLDGTFGTIWHGGNAPEYDDILVNGMYERLMKEPCLADGFREALKERWLALRSTTLSNDSLIELLSNNHNILIENGAYERESLAWSEYTYDPSGFDYMTNWINNRTNYLDAQFGDDCVPILNTVDYSESAYLIGPNPTYGLLNIRNENDTTLDVSFYNNVGQLILEVELYGTDNSILLDGLRSGFYTMSIVANDNIETHRIEVR